MNLKKREPELEEALDVLESVKDFLARYDCDGNISRDKMFCMTEILARIDNLLTTKGGENERG